MPISAESKGWPFVKAGRSCNLGMHGCTAFKLTIADEDYHNKARRLMGVEGLAPGQLLRN